MAEILEKVLHSCCTPYDQLQKEKEEEEAKKKKQQQQPMKQNGVINKSKASKKVQPEGVKARGKMGGTTSTSKFTRKDTKYENVAWGDMPKNARAAAEVLGHSEETWKPDGWAVTDGYWWEDLTEEQQKAAITLGWDMTSWDSKYEGVYWADLPATVKSAAEQVGFTQQMWDDGEWPESLDKWWDDLTSDEQAALMVLGYSKYKWE